jgi:hypothetical protein
VVDKVEQATVAVVGVMVEPALQVVERVTRLQAEEPHFILVLKDLMVALYLDLIVALVVALVALLPVLLPV